MGLGVSDWVSIRPIFSRGRSVDLAHRYLGLDSSSPPSIVRNAFEVVATMKKVWKALTIKTRWKNHKPTYKKWWFINQVKKLIWHQPQQCTVFFREIPQNTVHLHETSSIHPPKMDPIPSLKHPRLAVGSYSNKGLGPRTLAPPAISFNLSLLFSGV